ncbi:MAG: hypothetical protein VX278_08940 [Myxococcota bacterium]|nr:hypothetical protein [Myxococcota bacterium]
MRYRWDDLNRRFDHEIICPFPSCGAVLGTINKFQHLPENHVLDICKSCGRPFEWMQMNRNGVSIPWPRKANARFCSFSGRRLQHASPLDWLEHGGNSTKSSSQVDKHGYLFGLPTKKENFELQLKWQSKLLLDSQFEVSQIVSINIVNGLLIVCTEQGTLIQVDRNASEEIHSFPWPNGVSKNETIRFCPAIRGTHAMLVKSSEAILWDLAMYSKEKRVEKKSLLPRDGCLFMGPPLAISAPHPLFVLWQTKFIRKALVQSYLSIYDAKGEILCEIEADQSAAPPVYNPDTQELIWVNTIGSVFCVSLADILNKMPKVKEYRWEAPFVWGVEESPRLVLASNSLGQNEIWMASHRYTVKRLKEVILFRSLLPNTKTPLRWKEEDYGQLGNEIRSISIGASSHYPNTREFGEMVAISTEKGVYLSLKNPLGEPPKLICSTLTAGEIGTRSNTPPIICGAGVLVRLAQKIVLHWEPLNWGSKAFGAFTEHFIDGSPRYQSALALSGREVFVANDGKVYAYEIVKTGGL